MSYIHCQRLSSIREEYTVARISVSYVEGARPNPPNNLDLNGITLQQIQRASRNLEDTYIIRVFAEFEGILRDYRPVPVGRQDNRSIYNLINQIASHRRIPATILNNVQSVREYRNSLTHQGAAGAHTIIFQDVLARLNYYLSYL